MRKAIWKEIDFPTVYANILGVALTPFDIGLIFGQVGMISEDKIEGIPQVKVLLSPEQAANLLKVLKGAIDAYVKGSGSLRENPMKVALSGTGEAFETINDKLNESR